jgi:hypothetical protein
MIAWTSPTEKPHAGALHHHGAACNHNRADVDDGPRRIEIVDHVRRGMLSDPLTAPQRTLEARDAAIGQLQQRLAELERIGR